MATAALKWSIDYSSQCSEGVINLDWSVHGLSLGGISETVLFIQQSIQGPSGFLFCVLFYCSVLLVYAKIFNYCRQNREFYTPCHFNRNTLPNSKSHGGAKMRQE